MRASLESPRTSFRGIYAIDIWEGEDVGYKRDEMYKDHEWESSLWWQVSPD